MSPRRRSSGSLFIAYAVYAGLALLFAIAIGVRVRSSINAIQTLNPGRRARPPIDLDDPGVRIVDVTREAEAAGILKGDLLRKVNGKPYAGMSDLYVPVWNAHQGDHIQLQVERVDSSGSKWIDADVTLPSLLRKPQTAQDWITGIVIGIIMPAFCVLLGFFVVAVRIRDPLAWMVAFVLLGFSQTTGGTSLFALFARSDWFQPILIAYHQSLSNGWPIAMFLFGIYSFQHSGIRSLEFT